jgi:hypothetical protein
VPTGTAESCPRRGHGVCWIREDGREYRDCILGLVFSCSCGTGVWKFTQLNCRASADGLKSLRENSKSNRRTLHFTALPARRRNYARFTAASRPGGPAAQTSAQPGRAGNPSHSGFLWNRHGECSSSLLRAPGQLRGLPLVKYPPIHMFLTSAPCAPKPPMGSLA